VNDLPRIEAEVDIMLFYFVQQLKSEIDGLKKEIKKLELENACTHTELVDSKLKLSNTSKLLKEHKVVIEDLMAENAKLQEGLSKGGIEGWWEVDARQLLKAGGELTLEVGNLLERTGEGGENSIHTAPLYTT